MQRRWLCQGQGKPEAADGGEDPVQRARAHGLTKYTHPGERVHYARSCAGNHSAGFSHGIAAIEDHAERRAVTDLAAEDETEAHRGTQCTGDR